MRVNPFIPPSRGVTPFRQNQFGASFGGPVWIPKLYNGKNKTFFYFAYQGFRYTQNNDSVLKVPTAAQLAGDESSFPTQIYNRLRLVPIPPTLEIHSRSISRNQIPSNLIDPRMVAFVQAVLPQPVHCWTVQGQCDRCDSQSPDPERIQRPHRSELRPEKHSVFSVQCYQQLAD